MKRSKPKFATTSMFTAITPRLSGEPIGLEITAPDQVTLDQINAVLESFKLPLISPEELAPLKAAY